MQTPKTTMCVGQHGLCRFTSCCKAAHGDGTGFCQDRTLRSGVVLVTGPLQICQPTSPRINRQQPQDTKPVEQTALGFTHCSHAFK